MTEVGIQRVLVTSGYAIVRANGSVVGKCIYQRAEAEFIAGNLTGTFTVKPARRITYLRRGSFGARPVSEIIVDEVAA